MPRGSKVAPDLPVENATPPPPPAPPRSEQIKNVESAGSGSPKQDFHYSIGILNKLRRALDKIDEDDIKQSLIIYEQTIELFRSKLPEMKVYDRINWSLPAAMNPDWYHDKLSDRLQNTLLVSALLVTSTAVGFIYPPGLDKDSWSFRTFIYLNGISSVLFLTSIIFGIFYIENAMNRAYGESERLVLICKFYFYKTICQVTMVIGAILFPVIMVMPLWDTFLHIDAFAMAGLTAIFVLVTIQLIYGSTTIASQKMVQRTALMVKLCDEEGRLRPEYFPPDQGITREDIKEMLQWIGNDEFKSMTYGLGMTNKDEEGEDT